MRQLASLANEEQARQFTAYLVTQGIVSHTEQEASDWMIWIREEDDLKPAMEFYQQYLSDPDNSCYQEAVQVATTLLREESKRKEKTQKNYVEMRSRWKQPGAGHYNPLTKTLIAISIIVFLGSWLFQPDTGKSLVERHLQFADAVDVHRAKTTLPPGRFEEQRISLSSLTTRPWELWRLITPVFLHGDFIHILFNMMWLHQLGSTIENRYRTPRFFALVITIAILSVLAQSLAPGWWGPFSGGWNHVGMSGVVCGLFGFAWIKTRFDPTSGMYIRPETIMLMIGMLFLCILLTQLFESWNIANTAHFSGLFAGMLIAWISTPR